MLLLGVMQAGPLRAEDFVDRRFFATEGDSSSIFLRNISTLKVKNTIINAYTQNGKRNYSVTGSATTGNEDRFSYDIAEKDQGVGFLLPLGGAAFGADAVNTYRDLSVRSNRFDFSMAESFVEKSYRGHFMVDLTPATSASFSYRILRVQNEVAGNIFIGDDDRTQIKGTLTGYMVSFYMRESTWGLGMYHEPSLRGKSDIEGEQKILTTRGTTGLNFMYRLNQKMNLAFDVTRWYYKPDDRRTLSTSPVQGSSMSLHGVDFEQFLYDDQRLAVGLDVGWRKGVTLRGTLFRQSGAFIFEEDKVPGDDINETAYTWDGMRAGAVYNSGLFFAEAGLTKATREVARVQDTNPSGAWLNHRTWTGYNADIQYLFFGVGFSQ